MKAAWELECGLKAAQVFWICFVIFKGTFPFLPPNSVRDYMVDPGCCDLLNVFTSLCPFNDGICVLKQSTI